ncbi:ATP-binding protein [Streptomyces sp. I05A-00742]|uniref:ATP-binding protein n=1 Tax=Streptomyces sp. I05A-00742 TaxID=2732853 RepID=UPI001489DE1C|nr:ATP-binding protein [Streptomyces sp. I05A-00742]
MNASVPACPAPASAGPPPHLTLAATEQAPALARAYARDVVKYTVTDPDAEYLFTVALVVSELVTNSVRYGSEPGDRLRVVVDTTDARTRIQVHDTVRREPRLRPESDERCRGRGLYIVDALATWGIADRPFGKVVWAEVRPQ